MAPKAKFSKAFKAMKELGYTSQIVRPVLKNLLEVYEQNWSLIEDEDYAVLVDAILNSEESKVKESQRFRLLDEPEEDEPPLKRSRLRSQTVQTLTSSGVPSPSSNQKKDKQLHNVTDIPFESDGNERLHNVMDMTSESIAKEKLTNSAHCCVVDSEIEDKFLILQDYQREQKCGSPYSSSGLKHTQKIQLFSHEKSNDSDPLSPQTQLDGNCNVCTSSSFVPKMINEKCTHKLMACPENESELLPDNDSEVDYAPAAVPSDHSRLLLEGDCSSAKENFSTSLEVIELDTEDTSSFPQCCEDGSVSAKEFPVQGYNPESKSSISTEGKDSSWNVSHLDIASSCEGEVKLSVTFESSLPSNFRVPSLDEVLRLMEEKYLKSYNVTQRDFSVVKLMNDICESFIAVGTISTSNEMVTCADVKSALVMPEDLDVQAISNQKITNLVGFPCAPNTIMGTENFRSTIEIGPRILRFQSLNLSHCKIELPMKMSHYYRKRNVEALRNVNAPTTKSMVIVQRQHDLPNLRRSAYFVDDITKGEEDFRISLTNELGSEQQPKFNYIPQNIAYRDACVQFLLAHISDDNCCSNCFGDCLISELPCACACADETGGEFAYMPGGLVTEKFLEDCIMMKSSSQQKNLFYCQECPLERCKDKSSSGKCKGHVVRKFIKECWYKCGCTKDCGNRVVQRGIMRSLQVFMTKEKGWGLRTLEDLPKGAFICEYVGEIVTNMEFFDRHTQNIGKKHTYPVLLDADWCAEGVLKDEEALCLDATFYGNVARFINHRCNDSNLLEIPVEVETPDHHYYRLAFFTTREVQALEELTWDYGINFDDQTHPVEAFRCRCDSKFCRDRKAGNVG